MEHHSLGLQTLHNCVRHVLVFSAQNLIAPLDNGYPGAQAAERLGHLYGYGPGPETARNLLRDLIGKSLARAGQTDSPVRRDPWRRSAGPRRFSLC